MTTDLMIDSFIFMLLLGLIIWRFNWQTKLEKLSESQNFWGVNDSLIKMSNIEKIKASMIDLLDIDGLAQLSIEGLNLLELV